MMKYLTSMHKAPEFFYKVRQSGIIGHACNPRTSRQRDCCKFKANLRHIVSSIQVNLPYRVKLSQVPLPKEKRKKHEGRKPQARGGRSSVIKSQKVTYWEPLIECEMTGKGEGPENESLEIQIPIPKNFSADGIFLPASQLPNNHTEIYY